MSTSKDFSTVSLLEKTSYIQSAVDETFRLILNNDWNAEQVEHRQHIRKFIEKNFTAHFNREQMALLYDLNWIPEAETGYFSISHCKKLGGFAYSAHRLGFDVEELRRISKEILKRTCSEEEYNTCLRPEFLWVAKEAGLKALSNERGHRRLAKPLIVTDLVTSGWESHFENKVFSFRLNSDKALDFSMNKGFIFLEGDKLFCIFFA